MYTLSSFPHFVLYFYVFIKIINTFNRMVYISEYQPTCLGQSNHLTQFSVIFLPPEANIQELK